MSGSGPLPRPGTGTAGHERAEGNGRRPALSAAEPARPATWEDHWAQLVAAALLGTDRRPPPPPPPGPLAELLDELEGQAPGGASEPTDEAVRLLSQVATVTAARRAGLRPRPAPAPLPACPPAAVPVCPPAAGRRLAELLEAWPMLVDEWLAALMAGGWRLPEEHVVTLLARFRADPRRRALVVKAAGPLADWLAELFPELLAPRRPARPAQVQAAVDAEAAPPLPPDLAPLLELEPAELASTLVEGLAQGRWIHRHRPLLVRLVGAVDPARLAVLVAGLAEASSVAGSSPGSGSAGAAGWSARRRSAAADLLDDLVVLARTRLDMLAELTPTDASSSASSGASAGASSSASTGASSGAVP